MTENPTAFLVVHIDKRGNSEVYCVFSKREHADAAAGWYEANEGEGAGYFVAPWELRSSWP